MNKLYKLTLKRDALQRKLEVLNSELKLLEFEIEEGSESEEGMFLSKKQLHTLISILDHTIIPNDEFSKEATSNLQNLREELVWDVAEHFGYDLYEGTVDPLTLEFTNYKQK